MYDPLHRMNRPRLNLNDLIPAWERKFSNAVHDTEFERILRGDVNVPYAPGAQQFIRQGCTFAQDILSALIVRQRRVK